MKNKLKFLVPIICIVALLTVVALSAIPLSASDTDPTVSIYACNLAFKDTVYIMYAVDVEGVEESELTDDNFNLLIWTSTTTNYQKGTEQLALTNDGTQTIGGKPYYIFQYTKMSAKQMTDDIYAMAYLDIDGTSYTSNVLKYSVLQYVDDAKNVSSPNTRLLTLLEAMLDYGAAAQTYYGYKTDRLANSDFSKITVVNGTLDSDLCTKGLYQQGESVSMTANDTDIEGKPFSYWVNNDGAIVGYEKQFSITATSKSETYTAVYGQAVVDTEGGLSYTLLDDGTYSVALATSGDIPENIVIPETYSGAKVTAIGDSAFENAADIKTISIPYGIKTIGNNAFAGCTGLSEIVLPTTVTAIGNRALYGCTGITEFTIPQNVQTFGTQIFYKASNLTTVNYNSSYSPGSDNPILNLSHIEKVVFGGTTVPTGLCQNITNIKTVIINDSVTSISARAFENCAGLVNLTLSKSTKIISPYAFYGCTGLQDLVIPEGVEEIHYKSFASCTKLTNITIPTSLKVIKEDAWGWEQDYDDSRESVESVFITDLYSWCNIDFEEFSSANWGADLYLNGVLIEDLIIPDGVSHIYAYAFNGCQSITSVTIPNSVSSIGYCAFGGCTSISKVYVNDLESWLKISFEKGDYYYATTTSPLGNGAKLYVNGVELTECEIPNGVTSIGDLAFCGCIGLTKITIPDTVINIGAYAFSDCINLSSINIPDSVTSIGSGAFSGCETLTNIDIPDSVSSIGGGAFSGCSGLTNIIIPNSITTIENGVFRGCIGLTNVTISDRITSIEGYAFYGCSELINVILPDGVTFIGVSSFEECTNLISIVIPKSVTSIGESACSITNLEIVYYTGTADDWSVMYISSYDNWTLSRATKYYYSETEPETSGNYWRYVNGVPTIWE